MLLEAPHILGVLCYCMTRVGINTRLSFRVSIVVHLHSVLSRTTSSAELGGPRFPIILYICSLLVVGFGSYGDYEPGKHHFR